ncbi:MAG: 16S rRNA (guanine(966)-N(2))-methyltransferase RsmD [Burkholderiales bacterium]|nr:MAG: 16S rRNA (guanine(966)-N(2))-methyltransferase RsmD [Burkholderiales bacterium]
MKKIAPTPPSERPKPARRPLTPPGEVRIIGGQWKRSKLPVAAVPGLRPTPDRVRETLFNWLGQDLAGWRCADVFAGTGALGFEAASRGATEVFMLETDTALVAQLVKIRDRLQATAVRVERADGLAVLRRLADASFDVIFLDPPFDSSLFDAVALAAARVVKPEGFVYLEAPKKWTDELLAPAGLALHRYLKAGAVHAHLLRRTA